MIRARRLVNDEDKFSVSCPGCGEARVVFELEQGELFHIYCAGKIFLGKIISPAGVMGREMHVVVEEVIDA